MRAPSKKESAKAKREEDASRAGETETKETITRTSPFRVSTLVSIAPVRPTSDFGVMSRHEGDPVPHEHQFYRATLKGLFSLNMNACGTFWHKQKTGFQNLDEVRTEIAKSEGLDQVDGEKAYRLKKDQRIERIAALFEGMANLEGGAKLALHYTDVSPVALILAVTKGGNHIFGHIISANGKGLPEVNLDALKETMRVFNNEILSDIYIGWVKGYAEEERSKVDAFVRTEEAKTANGKSIILSHPRDAFKAFIADLKKSENSTWLD